MLYKFVKVYKLSPKRIVCLARTERLWNESLTTFIRMHYKYAHTPRLLAHRLCK